MRRLLRVLGIVAALNLMGAGGVVYYAFRTGQVSPERLAEAWQVLVGPTMDKATTQPTSAPAAAAVAVRRDAPSVEEASLVREELDRREREIQQQWALLQAAQLQLLRDREQFEDTQGKAGMTTTAPVSAPGGEGYKKELEYLAGVKPKQAKEFLRMKKDADAVEVLLALEPRVGRKIIEACKTQDDRLWMGRILEQLRQRNDGQAEALAAGAP